MACVPVPQPLILNVDDYEPGRYAVTRILKKADFRVAEAACGTDALRLAREERPDLVLLDVNLPDINGFEVCRRIKADPDTARIPVLHISASSVRTSDRTQGLDSGADTYLIEPVEPEVLVATIRATLRARRAEEQHRHLAQQWQTTFDAIGSGIALLDETGACLRWNRALHAMLPRTDLGRLFWDLWEPAAEEQKAIFLRALESGTREEIVVEHGGRWLQVTMDAVAGDAGAPAGAVYTVDDITSRRRLEDQFREAQKYESIGQLAGGVAHDFNNLLTAILGNASLVLSDLAPQNAMRARVEEIVKASDRAAHLTRQLLAYSGRGHFVLRHSDLSALVRDIEELLRASLPHTVQLRFDLPQGLPQVNVDRAQLQQLIMNLAINAGEAIGQAQGIVSIGTGVLGEKVWLEVRDTGPGISPEVRSHLFDPFFTTKFMGRGLGLAAVAGIVRGHGGEVEVNNAPTGGAIFRVLLPALAAPEPVSKGKKLVLVVDDEELVRRVAQAALEIRGYRVMIAENGLEAVEAVRAKGPEIAAVLLDLTMPVMSGEEAMEQIGQLAPNLKVIASSGYSEEEAARRFAGKTLAGFLQKPYTSRELAQKIEAVLK